MNTQTKGRRGRMQPVGRRASVLQQANVSVAMAAPMCCAVQPRGAHIRGCRQNPSRASPRPVQLASGPSTRMAAVGEVRGPQGACPQALVACPDCAKGGGSGCAGAVRPPLPPRHSLCSPLTACCRAGRLPGAGNAKPPQLMHQRTTARPHACAGPPIKASCESSSAHASTGESSATCMRTPQKHEIGRDPRHSPPTAHGGHLTTCAWSICLGSARREWAWHNPGRATKQRGRPPHQPSRAPVPHVSPLFPACVLLSRTSHAVPHRPLH